MKRFPILTKLLAACLLSVSLTAAASAASYGVGTVTASSLHLRARPTTSSASLTQAVRGSTVEVLADAVDGWYEVSFRGITGYMFAQYLDVVPNPVEVAPEHNNTEAPKAEESPAQPESEKDDTSPRGKVTLNSGYLNLRSEASMKGAKVGIIPNHTVLKLEDHTDGWYQVSYQGATGFVAERYITVLSQDAVPSDTTGEDVVALAATQLGKPYRYAATGPDAFDCSGFTVYLYKQFGYELARSAADQFLYHGTPVAYSDLQKGDLVFFKEFGADVAATHVGLYVGDGQFIHASSSGSTVKYSSLSNNWFAARYVGAKRVL